MPLLTRRRASVFSRMAEETASSFYRRAAGAARWG